MTIVYSISRHREINDTFVLDQSRAVTTSSIDIMHSTNKKIIPSGIKEEKRRSIL